MVAWRLEEAAFLPCACFAMAKTRELPEQTRNAIISKHKQSYGYKTISKALGIPPSTVRNVIKKFAAHGTVENLPGRGGKRKIDERTLRLLVRKVAKKPGTTSKELQAELETSGVVVSTRTISRTLNETRLHGRRPPRSPPLADGHKRGAPGGARWRPEACPLSSSPEQDLLVVNDEQEPFLAAGAPPGPRGDEETSSSTSDGC